MVQPCFKVQYPRTSRVFIPRKTVGGGISLHTQVILKCIPTNEIYIIAIHHSVFYVMVDVVTCTSYKVETLGELVHQKPSCECVTKGVDVWVFITTLG